MRARLTLLLLAILCACHVAPYEEPEDPTKINRLPYEMAFEGNDSISERALRSAARVDLDRFVERGFKKAAIDDAAWSMRERYLAKGFPFASVDYEYEPAPGEIPRVRILVDEGPQTVVSKVHFRGATWFPSKVLHRVVQTPGAGLLRTGDPLYIAAKLESASQELQDAYYENGFLAAKVSPPETTFNADRTEAEVVYVIEEGVRSVIQDIEVPDELPDAAQLRKSLKGFLGQAYFPRVVFQVRAAVVEHYARRGYPDVEAEVLEQPSGTSGQMRLSVDAQPGTVVRVRQVLVEGNEETRSSFIRSRVALKEGDVYDRELERRSFQELYRTGLFRVVRINLVGEGDSRDLVVTVEELNSLELYFEPGYGTYERFRFRAGITERDLFGTGRRGKIEALVSQKAQGVTATLTDPWLFDSQIIGDLSLFAQEREEPSFTSVNYGGQALLTREWTRQLSLSTGYQYRKSDAVDIKLDAPNASQLNENVDLSIISFASTWDHRDSVFLPREGRYARALVEFSDRTFGSDIDFVRITGTISEYWRFAERSGLVFTARTGFAIMYGDTATLPLQERFFNGGANSVRSFRESQLGPKDTGGNPVGGDTSSTATVEFRYPLWKSFEGSLFVDAGNVNLLLDDYLSFRDIRYGIGPGIRWLLPIGPVRLDWGINPNPRDDESHHVLQFSVGSSF
ncbi:MAG: outer membrane protein assembly factor BamA [Planctomycetes bacterium]|nr:outer membrane protein assembly factor BamA [Planctomycetota bacterium]MCB9904078.1 outer membrane protein assembly factor BamA [Planctomycetota bacterium]